VSASRRGLPAGTAGPIIVPLFSGSFSGTDGASGCVESVGGDLIEVVRHDPAAFSANVRSAVFPAGAVFGQLVN
jgi:hypothetical protein